MPETRSNDALVDEPPTRRRRRIWPWVLGIFGLLIAGLVVAGFFAAKFVDEALDVRADLEAAKSRLGNVTELVRSGDQAQFDAVATEVLAYTASADEKVQGPLWEFASWVPFVGQNVAAVRATTEATHILVRDALPAIFPVLGAMQRDNIRFEGGGFNLEPFRQALGALPAVDAAFVAGSGEGRGDRPRRAACRSSTTPSARCSRSSRRPRRSATPPSQSCRPR